MSSEAWTSQARMEEWVTTRYLTLDTIVEIGRKSRSWINDQWIRLTVLEVEPMDLQWSSIVRVRPRIIKRSFPRILSGATSFTIFFAAWNFRFWEQKWRGTFALNTKCSRIHLVCCPTGRSDTGVEITSHTGMLWLQLRRFLFKFHVIFSRGSESSKERKFQTAKVPWTKSPKVPGSGSSTYGTFAPGSVGRKVPVRPRRQGLQVLTTDGKIIGSWVVLQSSSSTRRIFSKAAAR